MLLLVFSPNFRLSHYLRRFPVRKRNFALCACAFAALAAMGCNENKSWSSNAVCGNGVIERGEICDVQAVNVGCDFYDPSVAWVSGRPACSSDCKLTQGTCSAGIITPSCGNGILDDGEACDGTSFRDSSLSCASFKGNGATGSLTCLNCVVSDVACVAASACNNGNIDNGEKCDGSNFNGKTCEDFVAGSTGNLNCINCTAIDASGCTIPEDKPVCGDNNITGTEVCDGTNFNGATCASVTGNALMVGALSCADECSRIDSSACKMDLKDTCGDNLLGKTEICDGELLPQGATCASAMDDPDYEGTLKCKDCQFDTSECTKIEIPENCNGEALDPDTEECDGEFFLDGASCDSYLKVEHGESDGSISCTKACKIDFSGCSLKPKCGDNIVNGDEQCDIVEGEVVTAENVDCSDFKGDGATGVLKCNECVIDSSECVAAETPSTCNDGTLDEDKNEQCDVKDDSKLKIAGFDCGTGYAFDEENWACADNCTINKEVSCKPLCNNGTLDNNEECDVKGDSKLIVDGFVCDDSSKTLADNWVCGADCLIDRTASCVAKCGNNKLDDGEVCDMVDGVATKASSFSCGDGKELDASWTCSSCTIADTFCKEVNLCGNSTIDPGEACDGSVPASETCASHDASTTRGAVKCVSCQYDYSDCHAPKTYTVKFLDDVCKTNDCSGLGYYSASTTSTVGGLTVKVVGNHVSASDGIMLTVLDTAKSQIEITGFTGVLGTLKIKARRYSDKNEDKLGAFYIYVGDKAESSFIMKNVSATMAEKTITVTNDTASSIVIKPYEYLPMQNGNKVPGKLVISEISFVADK